MGIVWGAGLVVSGAVQIWLIYLLDLDQSVAATNVVALAAFGLCGGWNVWLIARSRRLAQDAAPHPQLV